MTLARAAKTRLARETINSDLASDRFGPGARYYSVHELAQRFEISHPTASRLLREYYRAGKLVFRRGVGACVPGTPARETIVQSETIARIRRLRKQIRLLATALDTLVVELNEAGVAIPLSHNTPDETQAGEAA